MTSIRKGDIVLIPYPYTDMSTTKRRPSLVISSTEHNASKHQCILMPISSQTQNAERYGYVMIAGKERVHSGLLYDSVIKIDILFTFENSMIVKKIGSAPRAVMTKVYTMLKQVLAIS
jgi:mRNA interferase MazF